MALTVVTSPTGFRPVGTGRLDLVLQEASIAGKANYHVVIQMNGITGSFNYYADPSLLVTCDMAPIIRSFLQMSPTVASRYKQTYAKYQAVWDTGSDAQVLLTADLIYAYIGSNNYLNLRTSFNITSAGGNLLNVGTLYAWVGRTAYVDFLHDASLNVASEVIYTPAGGGSVSLGAFAGNAVNMESIGYASWTISGTISIRRSTAPFTVYKTINVTVLPECLNPVYIKWLNDFGGLMTWLFDYNQLLTIRPGDTGRNKLLLLFQQSISDEKFLILEELNRTGAEYGDNLKIGTYLVDFTTESAPINLVVESVPAQTQTKAKGNNLQMSFRYPLIENIDI